MSMSMRFISSFLAVSCLSAAVLAGASTNASLVVPLYFTAAHGVGESVGSVEIKETADGLLFTALVHGLTPGAHGFHIHDFPSCADDGMKAGGHFDPLKTGKHLGPDNNSGHLGDLPVLMVDADGTAPTPVLAKRLKKLSDIEKHSLMLHDGGDNYSDEPQKLGGGGHRMVCGVIP